MWKLSTAHARYSYRRIHRMLCADRLLLFNSTDSHLNWTRFRGQASLDVHRHQSVADSQANECWCERRGEGEMHQRHIELLPMKPCF